MLVPHRERGQHGFTIIELMVVLSVIAVLMGIAVPTFVTAESTAQDTQAQSHLRSALDAANTAFVDTQTFNGMSVSSLQAVEPSLHWSDAATTGPHLIDVLQGDLPDATPPQAAISFAVSAGNGRCWYALQADGDSPYYGRGAASGGQCSAVNALTNVGNHRTFTDANA